MELYVMTKDFVIVGVVEEFKSLIWAKRYWNFGDCEVYIKASEKVLDLLKVGNIITRKDDDMVCIIEYVEIKTSAEDGDYVVVKGSDARCLLDRRIVWGLMDYVGSVEGLIRTIVDDNVVNPPMAERRIQNTALGEVAGLDDSIEVQISYANVGEKVRGLCETYLYGSRMILDNGVLRFGLYEGSALDLIFATEFDNLIKTDYIEDYRTVSNVALVGGEGEGSSRRTASVGTASGLERRELFVDARSISSDSEGLGDYDEALRNEGLEELSKHSVLIRFDGDVDTTGYVYKYKRDYNVGDVVTIRNGYGQSFRARITEAVEGWDDNGYNVSLTLVYTEGA